MEEGILAKANFILFFIRRLKPEAINLMEMETPQTSETSGGVVMYSRAIGS